MRMLSVDLRGAARALARSPLFATIAIVSVGLALALTTTMFALIDAALHPPVPSPYVERLFTVNWRGDDPRRFIPGEEKLRAMREGLAVAEAMATVRGHDMEVVAGREGSNETVSEVSVDYFRVLGVSAHVGRTLGPVDVGQRVAVISFGLWRSAFGERPLASTIEVTLDDASYRVVGVMPPGMLQDIWIPEGSAPLDTSAVGKRPFAVVRVRPGVTKEGLRAEMGVIGQRLQAELGSPGYPLAPIVWDHLPPRPEVDRIFTYLFAVAVGVLAIACANLATLLLARGAARRREMAVRLAIGASRWAVARRVLFECAWLGLGGVALGLLLTRWAARLIAHWAPRWVPQLGEFVPAPSWRVFAFGLAAAAVVMALTGVLPAVRAASVPPAEPLKDGAGTTRRRRDRYSFLVVTEVALSTGLLMAAALLLLVNWRLARYEFGFNPRRLVAASVLLPRVGPSVLSATEAQRVRGDVLTRLQSTPGVQGVATVASEWPDGPVVLGENGAAGERSINLRSYRNVSSAYLRTLGLPIIQGRDFAPGDEGGSERVAIVDEAAARRLWPEFPSPVGRMLKLGSEASPAPWVRVIGVTPSLGRRPDASLAAPDDPNIYVLSDPSRATLAGMVIAVDTRTPEMQLTIRRLLRQAVGDRGSITVESYTAGFDEHVRLAGFLAKLFCALSVFALVLCGVGLYGVLAYAVSQRTREFAIRMALGARAPSVARLVVGEAAVMALAGIGLGAVLALVGTYGLASAVVGISLAHAKALVAAEAVLLVVAVVAAWGPVRRALRADPAHTLQAS